MKDTFLASTPKSEMHGLSRQGIGASKSFIQLRDIVRGKLGEEHAQLFAEPVENRDEHAIDWYTPLQGPVRRLLDLPPGEQRPYRERARTTAREIAVYADELAQSPENARQLRGHILELALCCPGEDALLLVGDRPVCVNWGYGPGTPGQAPLHLCELSLEPAAVIPPPDPPRPPEAGPESAAEPKPVVPPPGPKERRRPNWWWLLPAALACVALCLALFDMGLLDMAKLDFPEPADVTRMRRDNDELARRLADMKRRAEDLAKRCEPPKAPPPAMVIPDKPKNMAFLKGRWRCESGLRRTSDGEEIVYEFDFDGKGGGTATVHEPDGDRCVGPVRGTLAKGGLHLEVAEQVCGRSGGKRFIAYEAQSIDCKNEGNAANCVQKKGKWACNFIRVE